MTVYIALLRGINVGGKNMIKMAKLRESLTAIGLENVQTYIQSGNILFQSDKQEKKLREEIKHKIMEDYRLSIPVILRTAEEWEQLTTACPFSAEEIKIAEADSVGESLYVAFFPSNLSIVNLESLQSFQNEKENIIFKTKKSIFCFMTASVTLNWQISFKN